MAIKGRPSRKTCADTSLSLIVILCYKHVGISGGACLRRKR
jgi:hypothetical protein